MVLSNKYKVSLLVVLFAFSQCKKDKESEVQPTPIAEVPTITTSPSPYEYVIPPGFPTNVNIPNDNPMTIEGVALGKKLFYDPILSGDNTQSCGSCHAQANGFSDENQFSEGIDGLLGDRNSPTIINAIWTPSFFWDGRAATLEEQALGPVPNPIEMHLEWTEAVIKLQANEEYPSLFEKAFETKSISKELVAKAIAQFERTLISANSRYDKWINGGDSLSAAEERGYNIFFSEKGDCFHCHGGVLFTDNVFHNNGLDANPVDIGLGKITENFNDNGKFKTPTLRNIEFSAPYMHDGRFATLEEVVEFYNTGTKFSNTIDPLIVFQGLQLTAQEKSDLVAFMKSLTDTEFLNNPNFSEN